MTRLAFIFDTETSGLIDNHSIPLDKQPEIIEFYGTTVDLDSGKMHNELDLLIKPRRPVPAEITRITGLTDEDLKGAPPFADVAMSVRTALEGAPRVIAHNLSFDQEMVDTEYERLGQTITWPRRICTVEQTLHRSGFRLSLTALHELLFQETFPSAHRAKADVMALVRVCVELRRLGDL